jgi:hypothetical protein
LMRYVGRRVRDALVGYSKRLIDSTLSNRPPSVRYRDGKTTIEIPSSHLDDQVIFDGKQLIIVNPTSRQDIKPYPLDQIEMSLDFATEGASLLQGIATIRSAATGDRNPMLLLGRGSFVVKAKGRNEELVRVPMVDPVGFYKALFESIQIVKDPPPIAGIDPNRPEPLTPRDYIHFHPEDDALYRPDREPPVQRDTDSGAWGGGSSGGGGSNPEAPSPGSNPTSTATNEDLANLVRHLSAEVEALRNALSRPGLNQPDSGDVVEGEFREA